MKKTQDERNAEYEYAIIGGGVVGTLVAREITKYSKSVVVIEKENDCACGATKANSAIVHAGYDAHENTLKAIMNVRGSEMFEKLCLELGVHYNKNGALVVGNKADSESCEKLEILYNRGVANGVKDMQILQNEELKALEPSLCDDMNIGLYAPTSAITCPYMLAIAALGNAMDNGCAFVRNFCVDAIENKDGYYYIKCEDDTIKAKVVINCAGLFSDKIARMVGDESISLHARKGEYMLLDKTSVGDVKHTIFTLPGKMGKGILVSPTVDNNLLLGPTAVDLDDEDKENENRETTSEGLNEVREKSQKMVKNINYGRVITSFTGLRSVGTTHDFIIHFSRDAFLTFAGIESPGLSSSPALAEYAVKLLFEKGLLKGEQRKDFDPIRRCVKPFCDLDEEEKAKWIKKDKSFAKIICRCEQVTEGHVKAALTDNPKALDLDAIKRRTRSGMGQCQGGFCSPHIIKMLCQFGVPTKKGKGSTLIVKRTDKAFGTKDGGFTDEK